MGREKALASAGHVSMLHPEIQGVINLQVCINQKWQTKMVEALSAISVLSRLGSAFNRCNFQPFCLKSLQVKCFECLLKCQDIIAVLPTGFGKSLMFQLLPDFLSVKADKNIVIVVCPLNSIIEDQLKVLQKRGITADVLQLNNEEREAIDSLFNYSEQTIFK